MAELTAYEERALREIRAFKEPEETRLASLWRKLNAPVDQVAELAFGSSPGATVVQVVQDVLDLINDGATWTVRKSAIYGEFRARSLGSIETSADIHRLGLHEVDRLVAPLSAKYQALAAAEGAGSGLLGGIGLAADVALVVGLALRAVGEYATYYGFDLAQSSERAYGMSILSAAACPTVAERRAALAELSKLSLLLSGGEQATPLESEQSVKLTKKIAEALAVRLLKAKLGQLVPLAGAAIAGGYNVWFLRGVTATAYQLYRERMLLAKHGESVLAA